MGEDVDFFEFDGTAKRQIVEALRRLDVSDPELLARLIDGHAGFDFDARLFGLEAERTALRARLFKALNKLQSTAAKILDEDQADREVSALEIAVADLIMGPNATFDRISAAQIYLENLRRIATMPLRNDQSEFKRKLALDAPVTRVVTAVADYCRRKGIPFTGAPRRQQADNAPAHIAKSPAATLTESVLHALHIDFEPQQLATHMNKARELIRSL